jgi:co-chaperonin GroES (HSP10)
MTAMKRLIVVGDRVLVKPGEGEDRTKVGLYLPATAVDNQAVQTGKVVAVGPGTPIGAPADLKDEPW